MKVSVVVAAYDERENITPLTRRLLGTLGAMRKTSFEMIFVVEGTDGTREVLETIAAEGHPIRVLYAEVPRGLGNAFRRGFAAVSADTDVVVTLDADLNHQPEEIPRLVAALSRRSADIVIGSRFVTGSHVEGMPLWKRFLSGTMNVAIKGLFGLDIRDKTSGFRVYRAAALGRLPFANDDFAFLPEILVLAHRAGLTTVEEPIRFVYRVEGVSKMAIAPTVRSYVRLLLSRLGGATLAAVALLVSGFALRLGFHFPVHKLPADADSLLTATRAFRILEGHLPVFYSGVRLGALESYVHALSFLVFGVSRAAVVFAPLLAAALLLPLAYRLCRRLLPGKAGLYAFLFIALPSPSVLIWTSLPNGYPFIFLFLAATLATAERLKRLGPSPRRLLAFGLAAGLGWWCSIQIVCVLVPAVIWLLFVRPEVRRLSAAVLVAFGFLAGSFPWIVYNVQTGLGSFKGNFATQSVSTVESLRANTRVLFGRTLPDLASDDDTLPRTARAPVRDRLRIPVLLLTAAGVIWAGREMFRRRKAAGDCSTASLALLFAVAAVTCLLYVGSAAAGRGILHVRYVLSVWFLVAAGLGLLVERLSRLSRVAAASVVLVLLVHHGAGWDLPGSTQRRAVEAAARADEAAVRALEARGVGVVCGGFFVVYPFNFVSHERLLAVPDRVSHDVYSYGNHAGAAPGDFAIVTADGAMLERWRRAAGLAGEVVVPAPGYVAAIVQVPPGTSKADLLARAQDAWDREGLP